ncbi:MAG: LCP family protein [Clostridia bacterium]|nr:LCP family protein [Clostridia bacterium]
MKLFKTCMAAAIACSLFYAMPANTKQTTVPKEEVKPCVQSNVQSILTDQYVPPNTLQNILTPEYKNTLILCTDASGILYDSIFIIGHNKQANTVKLISLPRDLYVPYGEDIQNRLETLHLAQEKGIYKLNIAGYIGEKMHYPATVFEDRDVSFMADVIYTMTGISISEYAIFNFQTFEKLVDTVGGITLNIPYDIRNSKGEIILRQGVQTLNGQKALQYARTRKFYDEEGNILPSGGDFTRKEHQIAMMKEMIPQLVQNAGIGKLPAIVQIVRKEVRHSFSVGDLYRYYKLIQEVASGSVQLETHSITGPEIRPTEDGCLYIEFK